jgi:Flp pilus assembly protein TadB
MTLDRRTLAILLTAFWVVAGLALVSAFGVVGTVLAFGVAALAVIAAAFVSRLRSKP